MKRSVALLLTCTIACTMLSACDTGKGGETTREAPASDTVEETETTEESSAAAVTETTGGSETETRPGMAGNGSLKEPELLWGQVYNPNGFNTVTGVVHNPNDVAVDMSFNVIFYKDGVEVGRSEDYLAIGIATDHDEVIWGNYDIPDPNDVDEVKLDIIEVTESFYQPVTAHYEYTETVENIANFDFKFEQPITMATVWFLLYNDDNGNKKLDEGELVTTWITYTEAQEDTLNFDTSAFTYTDYEIYYNAY